MTGIVATVQHSFASWGQFTKLATPPAAKPVTAIATSVQRATRSIDIGQFTLSADISDINSRACAAGNCRRSTPQEKHRDHPRRRTQLTVSAL